MAASKEAIEHGVAVYLDTSYVTAEAHVEGIIDAAVAIDGDYNAGVEDAAKYLEDDYGYAVAAEIRKLKKAPRP